MNPETKIDNKCHEEALLRGGRLLRLRPPPAGIFDRLLLMPGGHAVFVEMKTATGQLNAMQRAFKQDLIRMQVPWRVVRSLDEFVALLNQLERTHPDEAA